MSHSGLKIEQSKNRRSRSFSVGNYIIPTFLYRFKKIRPRAIGGHTKPEACLLAMFTLPGIT